MDAKRDIYGYKEQIGKCISDIELSERNQALMTKLYEELVMQNLSQARILMYLARIRSIGRKLKKDLDTFDKEDLRKLLFILREEKRATETIRIYMIALKKFFAIVTGDIPDFLKFKVKRDAQPYPKELLIQDEINKMVDVCTTLRDKAIVSCLYESGARVGEFLNIKKKDIAFDDYGCLLHLNGKTGERVIRLVCSVPYVSNYLNTHLQMLDKDSYLWIVIRGKKTNTPIGIRGINKILFLSTKRAIINKPCNPHHFRHSRATELAKLFSDREMCEYFGWAGSSHMPALYSHLSSKDISNKLMVYYGIKPKEESKDNRPKQCSRCSLINPIEAKFCSKCSMVLDVQTAQQYIETKKVEDNFWVEKLMKDPESVEFLKRKMKEWDVKL